jgi:hypothetical protein
MQNEKLQINLAPGMEKAEVIIREVGVMNELSVKPPIKPNIEGVINTVTEFLLKRKNEFDQINEMRSHILVNRDKISITLITNENDEYLKGTICATLAKHPKFEEFGINSGKVWSPAELGMFFKMNRSFFKNKEENMKLVTELMNFKATVDSKIERSLKESGDRTDNFSQVVNSNLPKAFTLRLPLFKGMEAEDIEVETFAQINGREVAFVLLSPGANQAEEEIRDKAIDDQLKEIREICPGIAIIEQ